MREVRPGEEFAGHRIDRVIGRGGVSVVYLAEHLRLGRKVALKVLAPHLADDKAFRDRFIRESRTAAALDHPNIVDVYDAGEIDGVLYLSMRYVDGSDLGRVIEADGALDPGRAIAITQQMASALDAAHAEGLVHRDVKPGNILLADPGGTAERAFLADFGITKRTTTREALTRTGQFVGTIDYVAPEQILDKPVDGRTDEYSLGCVLFESLVGAAPFPRPTTVATIYAHLHDPMPTVPDTLGLPGMDDVIARALAKEQEDRFPTCLAMVDAARSQLAGAAPTQVVARPTPTQIHDRPPSGKARRIIAAVVAAAVLVSAVVAVVALRGPDPPADPGPSDPGSSSSAPPDTRITDYAWTDFPWQNMEGGGGLQGQVTITSATETADGTVIAGGHADDPVEDAAVWRRQSDRHWPREPLPGGAGPGPQKVYDLAAAEDRVAAVGYDDGQPEAWISPDAGHTWGVADVPVEDEGGSMLGVAANPDGGFIAFGYTVRVDGAHVGAMWTSANGSRWKRAPGGPSATSPGYAWDAAAMGDVLLAVGQTGPEGSRDAAVWERRDGEWEQIDAATFAEAGDQYLLDVAVLSDYVAVAVGNEAERSVMWRRGASGDWTRTDVPQGPGQAYATTVIPIEDRYLLAGGWELVEGEGEDDEQDAAIWWSRDGISWRRLRSDTSAQLSVVGVDEKIRALLLTAAEERLLAFGEATDDGDDQIHAQVWTGRPVA